MVYVPETIPIEAGSPELQEFLYREFLRIGDATELAEAIRLLEDNVAPDKPQNGDIRYADGTNWNPGGGEGFYGYVNGNWVELSEGIGSDPTFDDVTVDILTSTTINNSGTVTTGTVSATTGDIDNITAETIRLTASGDAALASTTHAFQIGDTTAANVIADGNEIMARNNGAAAQLFLNNDGGIVSAGSGGFSTSGPLASGNATITGTFSASTSMSAPFAAVNHVQFPAVQVPSADVNALDDYEEGTFTPRIDGLTTAGTGTYTTQVGRYTKIGRVVFFLSTCVWTAHTGTGAMVMEGLPFTIAAADSSAASVEYSNLTYTSQVQCTPQAATTRILIRQAASGAAVAGINMDTSATIRVAGFYFV